MDDVKRAPGLNPWRIGGWGLAALLVATPVVLTLVGSQFNWGAMDVLAATILVGTTGLAIELVVRVTRNPWLRVGVAAVALLLAATIWAELAVGLMS